MYRLLVIKRKLEDVLIFPFILTGRLIALLKPLNKEYKVYFFFPFYHTGGAEKVHSQIAQAAGGKDAVIFFTRRSSDETFLETFRQSGCVIKDISRFTDNKWIYFLNLIYRGIISGYINSQSAKPAVFNGQCNFAYKLSPWIRKSIRQIELIHSLNSFSYIRIPFLTFISATVMISKKRIEDHVALYSKFSVPGYFIERIQYIPNGIPIQDGQQNSKETNPFRILYAGRAGKEKRIPLILRIAGDLHQTHPDVQFEFLGDVSEIVEAGKYPFIKFYGTVTDVKEINSIYQKANLLIITSDTEGFPMVVMEAMANGCTILATPVGDIPLHIKNKENGFLFSGVNNEAKIVEEGEKNILYLKTNSEFLKEISEKNITYAKQNFNIEKFNASYRKLIGEEN
jgi:glycosyltransferase involved in cell wall biosynthesis